MTQLNWFKKLLNYLLGNFPNISDSSRYLHHSQPMVIIENSFTQQLQIVVIQLPTKQKNSMRPLHLFFLIITTLRKLDGDGNHNAAKQKSLMCKPIPLHVPFKFWYISLPSSAKQQREMTKLCKFSWRTWTQNGQFVILFLNLNATSTNLVPKKFVVWVVRSWMR